MTNQLRVLDVKKNFTIEECGTWLLFILSVFVFLNIRIGLINLPLNRDEASWAYSAQMFLNGIPLFGGILDTKLPGVVLIDSFFMFIFGQDIWQIRLASFLAIAISSVLIYKIARLKWNYLESVTAVSVFLLMVNNSLFAGCFSYSEHFAVVFMLFSVYTSLQPGGKIKTALSTGILASAAVMCKQQVLPAVLLPFIVLLNNNWKTRRIENILSFVSGFLILPAILVIYLISAGTFGNFIFMVWTQSLNYAELVRFNEGMAYLHTILFQMDVSVLIIAAIFVSAVCFSLFLMSKSITRSFFVISVLLCAAAVSAGLQFRDHYFLFLAPLLAFGPLYIPSNVRGVSLKPFVIVLLLAAAVFSIRDDNHFMLLSDNKKFVNTTFGIDPMIISTDIGSYLQNNTLPGDKIAVLGSEPEILYYSRRISATRYISFYDLMWGGIKAHKLELDVIREIETANPKYLVFFNYPVSWRILPSSDLTIFHWFEYFKKNKLELTGIVEAVSNTRTTSYYGKDLLKYKPSGGFRAEIYRLK
jgi:hypothetical protein